MITRSRPTLADILFAMRGSILPRIAPRLLAIAVVSVAAVVLELQETRVFAQLSALPFTLVGIALSIFMSFRNNACYDRWWEARRLWGTIIVSVRSFTRQVSALEAPVRDPMLLALCAFAGVLAARLRDRDVLAELERWPDCAGMRAAPNIADAILTGIGRRCLRLEAEGRISSIHHALLEGQLRELSACQAGCERIKQTPLPFAYSLLLHRTAHAFCLLLPFALAGALGWWTPLLVLIVSYTFFGLDALGDELEDPFGDDPNDLPLDALVRTIEREMLAAAGRSDLPPPLEPVRFLLR